MVACTGISNILIFPQTRYLNKLFVSSRIPNKFNDNTSMRRSCKRRCASEYISKIRERYNSYGTRRFRYYYEYIIFYGNTRYIQGTWLKNVYKNMGFFFFFFRNRVKKKLRAIRTNAGGVMCNVIRRRRLRRRRDRVQVARKSSRSVTLQITNRDISPHRHTHVKITRNAYITRHVWKKNKYISLFFGMKNKKWRKKRIRVSVYILLWATVYAICARGLFNSTENPIRVIYLDGLAGLYANTI